MDNDLYLFDKPFFTWEWFGVQDIGKDMISPNLFHFGSIRMVVLDQGNEHTHHVPQLLCTLFSNIKMLMFLSIYTPTFTYLS